MADDLGPSDDLLQFLFEVLFGDLFFSSCMVQNLSYVNYEDQVAWRKVIFTLAILFIVLILQLCFGKFINTGPLSKSLFFLLNN